MTELQNTSTLIADARCRYSVANSPHVADAGNRICHTHKSEWRTYLAAGRPGPWKPSIIIAGPSVLAAIPEFLWLHELNWDSLVRRTAELIPELGWSPASLEVANRISVRQVVKVNEVEALYHLSYWVMVFESGGPGQRLVSDGLNRLAQRCLTAEHARACLSYQRATRALVPTHLHAYLVDSAAYSAAASYPFLEAATRFILSRFIDQDGRVLETFHSVGRGNSYTVGRRCSSVLDLMALLVSAESGLNEEYRGWVATALGSFHETGDPIKGAGNIFKLRNSWSHGNVSFPYGQRVSLLACLVLTLSMRDEYESRRTSIVEVLNQTLERDGAEQSGYPPLPGLWRDVVFAERYIASRELTRRQPNGVYIAGAL